MTATHPADDALRAVIGRLRRTDWASIETASIAALRRDRSIDVAVDGYGTRASGGDSVRAGNHLSPTEAALFAGDRPLRDEHHELITEAVAALHAASAACLAMTAALRRIDEITVQPSRPYVADACAEPWCEDPATQAGRCEACRKWRDRYAKSHGGETVPVPRATIEARKALRARRRVHINGPFAGR